MQGGGAKHIRGAKKRSRRKDSSSRLKPLCRHDFIAVRLEATVADAIQQVRSSAQRGDIFYLYVVDSEGKLKGTISIRTLLTSRDSQLVRDICSTNVVALAEDSAVQDAYALFSEARFLSLPIVSHRGTLIGVVHAHELTEEYGKRKEDLFEERSRGELFELLGIQAEDVGHSPANVAFGRLPWLLVNIVGGSLSAFFIHKLGGGLKQAVEFLAFVPILLVVSESIGMQTASIVIANLHRASSRARSRKVMLRELTISLLLGLVCSVLFALAVHFWKGDAALTGAVAITIFVGAVFVSFLGSLIPTLFHKLKVDPRVAAGPVVLALADCITLLFYLSVALWVSR